MNLSEHFTLEELTFSETANKYKVKNTPTDVHMKTLIHTCKYFAEPLRDLFNKKYVNNIFGGKKVKQVIMKITSGYRNPQVNKLVGGATTSQHCNGEAIDFEVILIYTDGTRKVLEYNKAYQDVKTWVKQNKISVDQLIQEEQGSSKWVHGSYKAAGATVNRKQFLLYKNGKYIND